MGDEKKKETYEEKKDEFGNVTEKKTIEEKEEDDQSVRIKNDALKQKERLVLLATQGFFCAVELY